VIVGVAAVKVVFEMSAHKQVLLYAAEDLQNGAAYAGTELGLTVTCRAAIIASLLGTATTDMVEVEVRVIVTVLAFVLEFMYG
jgi:hypothetical protein